MILLAIVKRGLFSVVLIRPMMKSAKPAPKVVRAKPVTFWLALREVVRKEKRSPENTKALRCERTAKGFLIWIGSAIQCVNTQKPLAMKNNGFVLLLSICYQP